MRVHRGGPVETGRGFVLHSADYFIENSTLPIDEHVCLTATLEILKAIAVGDGPESALLALGYAGWAPGQLESEIQANGWLHCDASPELIFDADIDSKYGRALNLLGVDPSRLWSRRSPRRGLHLPVPVRRVAGGRHGVPCAACTPDFFLFDGDRALAYRGQFDASRPSLDTPITGADLRQACDAVLAGSTPGADQVPSVGCNIKWKEGNEPSWFG